jgi:hypothetical protein
MSFSPTRAVVRQMRATYLQTFIWFWVVVGGCWAVVATVIILIGDADMSVWQWFGTSPAKYFLMVLGIITAAVYLPVYVGHGITRRQFASGCAAFFGLASVAFGGVVLAGYLLELIMHAATGQFGPSSGSYPVASVGDGLWIFARYTVIHAAFVCTGWLLGATFYRFGPWIGIVLIPACVVPGFGADFVLGTGTERAGLHLNRIVELGSGYLPVGLLVGAVLLALGVGLAFVVVRDVPIHKVTG